MGVAYFLGVVFCILQIILFFKIWGMTNNVSKIRKALESKLQEEIKCQNQNNEVYQHGFWGRDVTGYEKGKALSLISTMKSGEVIVILNGEFRIVNSHELANIENYKVIYYR